MPLFATSEIREISPSGQLLKSVKVDGNPFSVAALDNGNYLVACGDAHCFIELNFETGDIVRKVNENDIEGAQLFFVAQLLPKRTVVCISVTGKAMTERLRKDITRS